ncbi:YdcF family protein [Paenibacillus radicis (ex Gao et al. 2016)]|uniref:Multidrug MFS transporter n=1 Tax=Paenibacillus radicis (ex Gao et al. 2016) TaxID=1737354 RepID=A0A917HTZ4_9BACL|nr:YdcF family protein [Paenibacillus radicis (ex Gao et al. 2016)]GGG89217.1 multidrug MFS transporter [Paenibacillus radicis (ex Gao et al. 2016)]
MKKKPALYKIITIAFLIAVLTIGYAAYDIWSFSKPREPMAADAVIVLGAAVWDGKPSPVLRGRIDYGIWLYEQGYVQKIIFTGGMGHGGQWTEAIVSRDYALEQGVNPGAILVETESTITEENLRFAGELAKEHQLHTFAIVSDPLHMKRALTIAKKLGMDAYAAPTPSSAYKSLQTKLPFLFRELFYYIGYKVTSPFRS